MTKLAESTNETRVKKALDHLSSMLVPNESLQCFSIQRRLFALLHRREVVSASTGRLIAIKRGLLGGFTPTDIRWQDVKNAQVRVGIFGSDLTVAALTQPDLAIAGSVRTYKFAGLRKAEAQAVYRICQAQEQAWREKRRLRELEELRAKSGGFQGGAGRSAFTGDDTSSVDDLTARLQRAKEMLDKGLISDSEYETIKARVVGEL
ncbi:SHOCT domain-containing protein [Caballeronia humi]|uniref:SHOCT domain-containing protein n=1 Tax=Caballeronia humi TaxID=326474 RepID=A0A158JDD0_9BURK|nr:SHOCT domain-containing protein [Caballeronia humi]SAL66705.1 hypothetical protein AWB65_06380 [Caballeronia humi]